MISVSWSISDVVEDIIVRREDVSERDLDALDGDFIVVFKLGLIYKVHQCDVSTMQF